MKAENFNQQIYKQQTLHIKNHDINILVLSPWITSRLTKTCQ